jgi:hypothetical protein
LIGYEAPSLGPDCMNQHSRRRHSPRPFRRLSEVRVDGSRISHVVDPASEESLYRSSEVEGNHSRGDCTHTCGLHSRRGRLIGCASIFCVFSVGAGRSSSAGTGACCHRIALRIRRNCRFIRGAPVAVYKKVRERLHAGGSPVRARGMTCRVSTSSQNIEG